MRQSWKWLGAVTLAIAVNGCSGGGDSPTSPTSVTFSTISGLELRLDDGSSSTGVALPPEGPTLGDALLVVAAIDSTSGDLAYQDTCRIFLGGTLVYEQIYTGTTTVGQSIDLFPFTPGAAGTYRVTFETVEFSGNRSGSDTETLDFTIPASGSGG
jgi:hypothetical protein